MWSGGRHDRPNEAELGGFFEALVSMRHRADGAREAHLAEIDDVLGYRTARVRREEGRGGDEVGGGLSQAQTACDVQVDVMSPKAYPAAGLQHRKQHGEPVWVPADHGAAWCAE